MAVAQIILVNKLKLCFFPADEDLRKRWERFVNRKDWKPSTKFVVCIKHFKPKYLSEEKEME